MAQKSYSLEALFGSYLVKLKFTGGKIKKNNKLIVYNWTVKEYQSKALHRQSRATASIQNTVLVLYPILPALP